MKKGQVTVFVIVAIMIVASLLVIFFFVKSPRLKKITSSTISEELKDCSKKIVSKKVAELMEKGFIDKPLKIRYQGENYTYLCYAPKDLEKCYNLYPDLKTTIKNKIIEQTKPSVEACFKNLKDEMQSRGYEFSYSPISYSIKLIPNRVKINLQSTVSVKKGDTALSLTNFNSNVMVNLNGFIEVASQIVNDEADSCYFDHQKFISLNPKFDILKISYNGSRLYTITERQSGKKFKFAVRSCSGGF